jgi:hypothetical protein
LIQIDGSPHAWFEDRAPKCTLIVFIDDATSRLVALQFVKAETTAAYFAVAKAYFERCGLPLAFYSDRYSVFRVNTPSAGDQQTQFGRAMEELDIALICANSPQAKGRVERANRTLQDRLVKELRLAGIASIDAANVWLPTYIHQHNQRFAVIPAQDGDAHRLNDRRLESILLNKSKRKLSKDMTFQHRQSLYTVEATPRRLAFPHATIDLLEPPGAPFLIERNGHPLEYRLLKELAPRPTIASGKDLEGRTELWRDMPQMARPSPPPNHPWRTPEKQRPPAPRGDTSNLQDGDIGTLR